MRHRLSASQHGFSMVELMVALVLGVVLTSGVISVFITSKNTYNASNAVGQVQEAGRYALGTLQPLLAMAGYSGCGHIMGNELNGYKNLLTSGDTDPVYMTQYGVYGFEYTGTGVGNSYTDTTGQTPAVATSASEWSPTVPPGLFTKISNALNGAVVKYSDILIIHEAQPNPVTVTSDPTSATAASPYALSYATTNAPPPMATSALAVAASCGGVNTNVEQVTAFQITSSSPGSLGHAIQGSPAPGNSAAAGNFNPTAKFWPNQFNTITSSVSLENVYVFYIGKSPLDGGTSLFEVQILNSGPNAGSLGTPQEIMPGVENMQLIYGIDTNDDNILSSVPTKFETADVITNDTSNPATLTALGAYDGAWPEVVSVRVALVVHSDANATENNTTVTTSSGTTQTLTNVVSHTFYMLGTGATDSLTYNSYADRRLRRLFEETFSVRSQLP